MTGGTGSLRDVWGSSGSDVFAVGASSTILHYDGTGWSAMTGGTGSLRDVWGSSGSDVFAVGGSGTILHYDGSGWSAMDSGMGWGLGGVWGSSGSDVFAVGSAGTILHYGGPPGAKFTGSPTSGVAPLEVTFSNASTLDYTDSLWAFGDGGMSTEEDPTHTYTAAGSYTVTLTVSGPGGSDTETKPGYITVYEPVTAEFTASPTSGLAPLEVTFTNASTGDYTDSQWAFGDGGTSTEEDPTHTYTAAGGYTVTLTVSKPGSSDTETKVGYITVYEPVAAQFTASPRSGLAPLEVTFTNSSAGDYTDSLWAFGDGETSTEEDPTHTYTAVGSYTVMLTVSGPGGSETETKVGYVWVALVRVYLPLVLRNR
jgi:PKD repeat protein